MEYARTRPLRQTRKPWIDNKNSADITVGLIVLALFQVVKGSF
jgi:hypothetical protein